MGTVKFSLAKRRNPSNPSAAIKFYAQAQASGEKTLDDMSCGIEQLCTVTRPDIVAVLAALQISVIESLQNGEIVRLGDLGSFRLALKGKGTLTEKEFSSSLIKKTRIVFTPSKQITTQLKALNFTHVALLPSKKKKEEDSPETPVD